MKSIRRSRDQQRHTYACVRTSYVIVTYASVEHGWNEIVADALDVIVRHFRFVLVFRWSENGPVRVDAHHLLPHKGASMHVIHERVTKNKLAESASKQVRYSWKRTQKFFLKHDVLYNSINLSEQLLQSNIFYDTRRTITVICTFSMQVEMYS